MPPLVVIQCLQRALIFNFFFIPNVISSIAFQKFLLNCVLVVSVDQVVNSSGKRTVLAATTPKHIDQTIGHASLTWTEKYKPKVPNDIIGNQSLVCC